MARYRPNLEKAVNDILVRHGVDGKRLSFRQAERLTGLSPATISELAKGNARTVETVRRFAEGLGEDKDRLLLLAGLMSEDAPSSEMSAAPQRMAVSLISSPLISSSPISSTSIDIPSNNHSLDENNNNFDFSSSSGDMSPNAAFIEATLSGLDREASAILQRLGNALKRLPSDSDRALWKSHLHHTAELLERFVNLNSTSET